MENPPQFIQETFRIKGKSDFILTDDAGYPFSVIIAPMSGPIAEATARMMPLMPPYWLGTPAIYFAVAIAFAFVLVVFI